MNDTSNTPEKISSENKKTNPVIDQPTIDILRNHQSVGYALGGGLLAAFISAVVWAVITVAIRYQIGYMAIAVGLFVGFSVRFFGAGIDKKFGFLGAALSLLGCLMGNLFSQVGFIAHEQSLGYMEALSYLNFNLITEILVESFDFMDLLFYAIAVYEGYRFAFRPITLELADSIASGQSDGRLKYEKYRMPLVLGSIVILAVFFFQVRSGVNGTKTYTYDSGQIMAEGELKNSKEHGWWTVYYENGNKMSTQYYDMGVSDSVWHWYYEDGQLSGIGRYRKGLEHGVWISYYENGTVLDFGRYLNGRKHGKWISRYESGNLMNTGDYNRDQEDGIWEYYHENGQLSSKGKMQNGERTGDWVGYYEDGVLSEELTCLENGHILVRNTWNENGQPVIIDGNGLNQAVYDDGKVISTGEMKNGKRYGMWTFFYENGDIQEKGIYENDKYKLLDAWTSSGEQMIKEGTGTYTSYYPDGTSVFETGEIENGHRTGIWRLYADMGYIITESTYADGDLSGMQRTFYEDGTPYTEGDMVDGVREGVWQWYHTNGILSSSVTFSKGKKEGKQTMWDENGRKIKEEYYKNGIFEKDELF